MPPKDDLASFSEALVAVPPGEQRPYRDYPSTWRRLAAAVASSPRARAEKAGESALGEPLWAITIEPPEPPRATTLVVAGIHAMEHVGVATAVALIERAVSAGSPWRHHRLVVMPVVNPDGFREVERTLAAGQRRFVRKNARGVDLNRNFAAGWDASYYLNKLLKPLFSPGDGPLSEPEARAVDHVASQHRLDYAISLHAFGRYFFYPYASRAEPTADAAAFESLTRRMAAAQQRPYRPVQLGRHSRFFKACGAEIDHLYERHGALSVLIEIGAGPRLAEPSTWLWPYRWFTPPAPLLERDMAEVLPAIEALAELPARDRPD